MIKAAGHRLMKEIHSMCNQIWRGDSTPEELIQAALVIVTKTGDLQDCRMPETIGQLY